MVVGGGLGPPECGAVHAPQALQPLASGSVEDALSDIAICQRERVGAAAVHGCGGNSE